MNKETKKQENRLTKKIKLTYNILIKSGLHIGDSTDNVDIGGVDNPVVRKRDGSNEPYIPGSSVKGKIRSLLEQRYGENGDNKYNNDNTNIGKLFGTTQRASRVIVRDAYLTNADKLKEAPYLDNFTELKYENSIDRKTGRIYKFE